MQEIALNLKWKVFKEDFRQYRPRRNTAQFSAVNNERANAIDSPEICLHQQRLSCKNNVCSKSHCVYAVSVSGFRRIKQHQQHQTTENRTHVDRSLSDYKDTGNHLLQ
jgi:hypothetical protein